MRAKDIVFNPLTFDEEHLHCNKCGWDGSGSEAHVAGFYGIGKYKEVLCPSCNAYLGNLSREPSTGGDADKLDTQKGPS